MTLISRLFGKPPAPTSQPQSRDADAPAAAQAGNDLNDGPDLRRLAGLAGGAAAGGAESGEGVASEERRAAQARLAALVDAGEADAGALMACESPAAAMCVLALCADRGRLAAAMDSITDPAQWAALVMSPSSRVRQAAAQKITDPATLRQLLKQVRERDHGVYKILKEKCDALTAEARRIEARAAEIAALCESVERHSHRSFDVHYEETYARLKKEWQAVQPPDALAERARGAMERSEGLIAAQRAQASEQRAREEAQREARRAQDEAAERARREADDEAEAAARREAALREEQAAVRETVERERSAAREAHERRLRQLGKLLDRADEAVNAGNTKIAAALRRDVDEQRETAGELPTALIRQMRALDARLNELKHWKDFAVAPKRRELIAEMQALIGTEEDPAALSKRIKLLQGEWRTTAKGIVIETGEEWEAFHRASQAAYEPCRKYFEAQAALRQQNLERRRGVLERLTAFEAAQSTDAPDGALMGKVMREAPQEWSQHFPVEREAGRALDQEFAAAMRRLQARMDLWSAANVAEKEALIRRAKTLTSLADGREATEGVKRLQALWKEVGIAPRAAEQALWLEFRAACDAVFQKREHAHQESQAALAASKSAAVALCEETERAAQLSGAALLKEAARMAERRGAFEALGELPRADARGLTTRFEKALDTCRLRVQQQKDEDARQAYSNLFEAGRRIRELEWAAVNGAPAQQQQELRQTAAGFIEGVPAWPSGAAAVVKGRLSAAQAPAVAAAGGERALRLLCVRAEILKEQPTPPPDETLRREYQVQRLMQGMGQGSRPQDSDWKVMALEWAAVRAVEPALHEALEARFRQTLGL